MSKIKTVKDSGEVVEEVVEVEETFADINAFKIEPIVGTPVVGEPVVAETALDPVVFVEKVKIEVPVFDMSDAITQGEDSERVMWLRERLGVTPGTLFDAAAMSAFKTWERANGHGGMGVVSEELWNELFA